MIIWSVGRLWRRILCAQRPLLTYFSWLARISLAGELPPPFRACERVIHISTTGHRGYCKCSIPEFGKPRLRLRQFLYCASAPAISVRYHTLLMVMGEAHAVQEYDACLLCVNQMDNSHSSRCSVSRIVLTCVSHHCPRSFVYQTLDHDSRGAKTPTSSSISLWCLYHAPHRRSKFEC
jgi:hypothetical protein